VYKRQPLGHLDYEQFTSFRYWKQKSFPIFFNCWLNNEHQYKFCKYLRDNNQSCQHRSMDWNKYTNIFLWSLQISYFYKQKNISSEKCTISLSLKEIKTHIPRKYWNAAFVGLLGFYFFNRGKCSNREWKVFESNNNCKFLSIVLFIIRNMKRKKMDAMQIIELLSNYESSKKYNNKC
jgi:hypothetical protein